VIARYFITLSIYLLAFVANATDQHGINGERSQTIDSLKAVIVSAEKDTTKAKALNQLAWESKFSNPDTAILLSREALRIYEEHQTKSGIANCCDNIGVLYTVKSDYTLALQYHNKALKIRKQRGNKKGMSSSYLHIGIVFSDQGDYPKALEYFFKALILGEEIGNNSAIVKAMGNIGVIYNFQSNYPQALQYQLRALTIMKEMDDESNMGIRYIDIGNIYENLKEYPDAFNYYLKGLKTFEELGDKIFIAASCGHIGKLFTKLYKKDVLMKKHNTNMLLDSALKYLQDAFTISKELSDEYYMANSLNGLGDVYKLKKQLKEAIKYYEQSVVITEQLRLLQHLSEASAKLAEIYVEIGDYKNAYNWYQKYEATKDSLFNEEKSKDIGKLEAKHEFETAEMERKRIEEEQASRKAEQKSRRDNLQYSGILIFIVLLFAGIFFIGKFSIPIRLAEGMIFFSFLLFFEFTLVLLDPYIEQYSSGAPAIKLGFNAVLAALIFPLHSLFETKLKKRLAKS